MLTRFGLRWASSWNESRPAPNCSSAIRQSSLPIAAANSCAALRWVNTLASGNCSTRYSPGTPCAVSCSPMKRKRRRAEREDGMKGKRRGGGGEERKRGKREGREREKRKGAREKRRREKGERGRKGSGLTS